MWLTAIDAHIADLPSSVHHSMCVCVLRWLEPIFVMDVQTFMNRVGVHMRACFYMVACGLLLYSHDGPRGRGGGSIISCPVRLVTVHSPGRREEARKRALIGYSSHFLHFSLALSLPLHATVTEKQETRLILLLKYIRHTPCPPPSLTVTERKQTDLFDRMVQSRCPPYVSVVL